jgi:hypothetical protein
VESVTISTGTLKCLAIALSVVYDLGDVLVLVSYQSLDTHKFPYSVMTSFDVYDFTRQTS